MTASEAREGGGAVRKNVDVAKNGKKTLVEQLTRFDGGLGVTRAVDR